MQILASALNSALPHRRDSRIHDRNSSAFVQTQLYFLALHLRRYDVQGWFPIVEVSTFTSTMMIDPNEYVRAYPVAASIETAAQLNCGLHE